MSEVTLNFRDYPIFEMIKSGVKTVETRALNPDEPERYFGNIKVGDKINLNSITTGEVLTKEVSDVRIYQDFEKYLEKEDLSKVFGVKISKEEARKRHLSHPGYKQRLSEYGIVAIELK